MIDTDIPDPSPDPLKPEPDADAEPAPSWFSDQMREALAVRDREDREKVLSIKRSLDAARDSTPTLEDVKAAPLGSAEREILAQKLFSDHPELIDRTGEEHEPPPMGLAVEPEVPVQTTFVEEMEELQAASPFDRPRLVNELFAKRFKFGGER